METPKIFESEYRFACIVWAHEPVTTKELIQLCQEQQIGRASCRERVSINV